MTEHDIVADRIDALTVADVKAWLGARAANCHRIARTKTGADKSEWLDDAAYFAAAIGMIEWSALERAEKN